MAEIKARGRIPADPARSLSLPANALSLRSDFALFLANLTVVPINSFLRVPGYPQMSSGIRYTPANRTEPDSVPGHPFIFNLLEKGGLVSSFSYLKNFVSPFAPLTYKSRFGAFQG